MAARGHTKIRQSRLLSPASEAKYANFQVRTGILPNPFSDAVLRLPVAPRGKVHAEHLLYGLLLCFCLIILFFLDFILFVVVIVLCLLNHFWTLPGLALKVKCDTNFEEKVDHEVFLRTCL